MKLLVTGAAGFLGRCIVAEALRRGHHVLAMVRPASDAAALPWADEADVELVRLDLRSRRGLTDALRGVDSVIHAAAAKSGDLYAQLAATVVATENLLAAMDEAGVRRLVAVSTFSIYDYLRPWSFSTVDESSPLESDARDRDEYAIAKLIQERLVREKGAEEVWKVTVLRPGVIYGKSNTWTARLGAGGGRTWIRIGGIARLPLTYVENCAEALVMAAESDAGAGQVLNVVDDEPPTQRRYAAELLKRMRPRPRVVPIPGLLMRGLAVVAWITNKLLFRGRAKLPSILVPARFHARFKPLRYTNARIKQVLGWKPRYSLDEALDRSFETASEHKTQPSVAVEQLATHSS